MTHLTDRELIDCVEGVLPSARQRHVDGCDVCRTRAADLRDTLAAAQAVDVPEPSPLYWDHLSARVREAVAAEGAPDAGWLAWLRRRPQTWAAVSAALTIALVAGLWQFSAPPVAPRVDPVGLSPAISLIDAGSVEPAIDSDGDDLNADEAWAIVRTMADEVAWSDGDFGHEAGLTARPGSAERAALSLTPEELSALAQILESEIKRARS